MKKTLAFFSLILLLAGCNSANPLLSQTDDEYLYSIECKEDFLVQSDKNIVAISEINAGLDSFSSKTQLYSLDDGKFIQEIDLKEDSWEIGLYDNGFYAISLTEKILYMHDNEKGLQKIQLENQGLWSFAMLSGDGNYVLYGRGDNCRVYLYSLVDDHVSDLCFFSGNWEPITYDEGNFYIKNASEGELISINALNGEIEAIFANKEMDFIAPHYSVMTSDDSLFIYDVLNNNNHEIVLHHDIESVIASGKSGVVTQDGDDLYFYHMIEKKVYNYQISNDLQNVIVKDDGTLLLLTMDGEMYYLSEKNAKSQRDIQYVESRELAGEYMIDVEVIAQRPEYPTGCESVSTVMLMKYLGEEINVATFIDDYLKTSKIIFDDDENMYASDPYEYFIGDPRTSNSYGCMAPVIEDALIQYYGTKDYIVNTTGEDLQTLCEEYISKDIPVIVWATIGMLDAYPSSTWTMLSGETYTWLSNEHCMLLVGYDEESYYFNDPWTGKTIGYDRTTSEDRYAVMGMQSLTIIKD